MAEPDYTFPRDRESKKGEQLNFNTVVGLIAVAAIGWVGTKTAATSEAVTKIETTMPFVTQSVTEVKGSISQLVTRAEMESRFSDMAAKNAVMDKRLMQLEYQKKDPQ